MGQVIDLALMISLLQFPAFDGGSKKMCGPFQARATVGNISGVERLRTPFLPPFPEWLIGRTYIYPVVQNWVPLGARKAAHIFTLPPAGITLFESMHGCHALLARSKLML